MRAFAMVLLAASLLIGASPASAGSSITGPRIMLAQQRLPLPAGDCNCDQRPISSADMAVRMIYAAFGAGAGYLYATMPVVTTAVAAAFAGGVVTMWVYSSYYVKSAPATLN